MINPKEIATKRFEKSFNGYKQEAVDNYLINLAEQFIALHEEKNDLEQKIIILAEKLEEYRNDEDSLRVAIMGAQKLGDSVIREAKSKADMILREANAKSERMVENAHRQVEKEYASLQKMQKEVTAFRTKLMSMYKSHLEMINKLPSYGEPNEEVEVHEEVVAEPEAEVFTPPAEDATIEISLSDLSNKRISPQSINEPEEVEEEVISEDDIDEEAVIEIESDIGDSEEEIDSHINSRFGPLKFGDGFGDKK